MNLPKFHSSVYKFVYKHTTKWFTWYYFGRNYDSPINPFEIIYIDPESVGYIKNKPEIPKLASAGVVSGDWDEQYEKRESDHEIRISLEQHIYKGVPWKNTPSYKKMMNSRFYEDYSESEIINRLDKYEILYHKIKEEGFKLQKELTGNDRVITSIHQRPVPELNEITVDVGRNGEFIWFGGNHRLAIARMLDISRVPVRVRVRHIKWQTKRDRVYNKNSDGSKSHPDLKFES